ncbi:excinuclease ATPase subunit [Undibacterium sp. Di27W]|uniref:excinuclease ATPase subunit n=1 Tax=Undibacterium sp. Di27W TaxID=3413036 RepID=UPI003BF1C2AF
MKRIITAALVFGVMTANTVSVQAADNRVMLPIANAMGDNNAQYRLGTSVKFYFGKQATPPVLEKIATDKTSLKTNAFGKTNEKACNWVFLSDMLQLQKRAKELGANAVINIVSNYDNVENSSETEFECHVGAIMAGVAFKGDFVRIAD